MPLLHRSLDTIQWLTITSRPPAQIVLNFAEVHKEAL
jgi:hypothetical protein